MGSPHAGGAIPQGIHLHATETPVWVNVTTAGCHQPCPCGLRPGNPLPSD